MLPRCLTEDYVPNLGRKVPRMGCAEWVGVTQNAKKSGDRAG